MWIFGACFGYVEAAVVIYLRALLQIDGDALFPMPAVLGDRDGWLMSVEVWREMATLGVLLVPACLAGSRLSFRFYSFMVTFGVWDLSYYLFLKIHLDWPATLWSYDILFLVPTVWVAPVACPVLIAATMVAYGSTAMWVGLNHPLRPPSAPHWLAVGVGTGLVLVAFMKDAGHFLAGGVPPSFSWEIFAAGYLLTALAGAHYLIRQAQRRRIGFG